ncbi:hypothetical protein J6590_101887 [Homalodisca vitripennis]|nr:hypothetical protein J6590_101887 [Homalodisca vitripennis]
MTVRNIIVYSIPESKNRMISLRIAQEINITSDTNDNELGPTGFKMFRRDRSPFTSTVVETVCAPTASSSGSQHIIDIASGLELTQSNKILNER